jgi:hypothetical protein
VLFVLAALLRLVYLVVHPPAALNVSWALSTSLLRDGSLAIGGRPTTQYEPLYPMFLAAARFAFHAPFLVDLLQVLVASTGVVLLSQIALALTSDPRVATIAAGLYAIDPVLVREAVGRSDNALFTTLLVAFACLLTAAATTRLRAALSGACLGLAILTRTTALPLIAIAPAILWLQGKRESALAVFAVAAVVSLPLAIRNHGLNGAWWPTRSGINLYIGNSARTAALLPEHDLDLLQADADRVTRERLPNVEALPGPVAERAVDDLLTREAWRFVVAHPWETLWRKLRNVGYIFGPRIVPYRPDDRARPVVEVVAYALFSIPVMFAAAAGLYVRRRRVGEDAILWAIALSVIVVNVIYVPATRYRAPMEFVLLFYAASALARSRIEPA